MKKIIIILLMMILVLPVRTEAVSVSARAAVVINRDNAEVIYQNNANAKLPMASTTKIMTGLLLCEYGNLDKEITVTEQMVRVEGSSMGLLAGDRVTLHDLLYGLMLASGNDAANTIAILLGGSIEGFVDKMNARARSMGLCNTNFATPSGLDDENHYTTAYELAIITKNALENETFAKVVATPKATLNYGNPPYRRTLTNHNKLFRMTDGVVGVKTGFTKKSGRCLVSAVSRDGKGVITVTLNDPNDWRDHISLSSYGLSKIKQVAFVPDKRRVEIPVENGTKQSISVNINSFYVNSLDTSGIEFEVLLPKLLYAPIKKGDIIGSVVYSKSGEILGKKDICAACDIEQKEQNIGFLDGFFYKFSLILREI